MPGDANGDNVYEVTVVAADATGNRGTMDVKVMVANENEDGTVTLSRTQPRVGVSVKASLTDPDGSISGLTWQWYQDDDLTANNLPTAECDDATSVDCVIKGAMSDTHTPTAGDVGETLTAVAMYTDGQGAMKTAVGEADNMVAEDTRNRPPAFVDQDTEMDGVQNESVERMVEENTKALSGTGQDDADDDAIAATDNPMDNVGSPVMAEDPDSNEDPLVYTLSGDDAGAFRVRDNGQIEVAAGTELDFETKDTYMVTLMAEDSFGASASIMVTIMVTDMDEVPEVTGDATAEYAENGMGPVATYTAVDPEMTEIVSWSLAGTDADVFDINDGVLTFKKSPDYEMPGDVAGTSPSTAAANDNMYEVTVQATDSTMKMGMKEVMVEVTNEEERGMVTLSALRPQSATEFTATLTDPDGGTTGTTWQWAKASSKNGSYMDIEDETSMAYTPVDGDIGSFLRATASYTDAEGSDKSAMMMSEHAVQRPRGANEAPDFPDQDPNTPEDEDTATRMVPENTAAGMAIGDPVVAEDANDDILTYTLTGTEADFFDINWATGQIMTKEALDAEAGRGVTYTVSVKATDPAGVPNTDTDNSDEITVTITVTDVDEPPAVTGQTNAETNNGADLTFNEVTGNIATALHTYNEDDPETTVNSTWSLSGTDSGKFEIGDGALTFEAQPDFEMPGDANGDNVYEVTVVAADATGNRGTMDVKVMVANENEDGTVTLSRTQPRVGVSVKASLTDPDGSISGLTWQWYQDDDLTANNLPTAECDDATSVDCVIKGAMSDTHTPTAGDVGETLTAVAMYTDGQGAMKTAVGEAANMVDEDTRNRPPAFVDQDTEMDGVQNESAERMVEENTKALSGTGQNDADDDAIDADNPMDNVGSPVMAEDPDSNADPLIYTLSGDDAGAFRVRDNGQIEVAAGTELDFETKDTYMVTLMAEDSFGASATIMVTIMVTDMDEAPEIMRVPDANVAPEVRFRHDQQNGGGEHGCRRGHRQPGGGNRR